jgi:hypothetical protein
MWGGVLEPALEEEGTGLAVGVIGAGMTAKKQPVDNPKEDPEDDPGDDALAADEELEELDEDELDGDGDDLDEEYPEVDDDLIDLDDEWDDQEDEERHDNPHKFYE